MAGRFSTHRVAAPAIVPAIEEPVPQETISYSALPAPAAIPEPVAPAASNPLLTDKLLDAKVRLHRRLIEEINLSALEKLPEDEMRAHIQQLVGQYVVTERLALNTEELNDFVSEILDEMTGLGPLEPLLKDAKRQRHPDQRSRMRLCRTPWHARTYSGTFQGRGASVAHRQQDRLRRRPSRGRVASDVRRAFAGRLPRQRGGAPGGDRRSAGVDPQILKEAFQSEQAGGCRCAAAANGGAACGGGARPRHLDHFGRYRFRQNDDAQRAVRLYFRKGALAHHRRRRRIAIAAAARRVAWKRVLQASKAKAKSASAIWSRTRFVCGRTG